MSLPVIYAGSFKPISLGIMVRELFWFSHVVIDCGKSVIEARGGVGVVETPIEDFLLRYSWIKRGLYSSAVPVEQAIANARRMIGTDYDDEVLIRIGLGFDDHIDRTPHAVICTELLACCTKTPNPEYWHRYRVKDAYKHTQFLKAENNNV